MKHLASHFHHLARMKRRKGREGLMMLLEGEGRLLFEEGVGDFSGPQLAHGDPAPLGPKDCKLKREELASYQFICIWSKGQSISRV